jgi:hypothetical protein
MKKFSALILLASLILLFVLWISGKMVFEWVSFTGLNPVHWVQALLKTFIVLLAYIAGFFAMIVITFIDILSSMIWKVEFPILHMVYEKFFLIFSKGWYWDQFHGSYLFTSAVIIFFIAMVMLAIPDTKRTRRVVYNPSLYASRP